MFDISIVFKFQSITNPFGVYRVRCHCIWCHFQIENWPRRYTSKSVLSDHLLHMVKFIMIFLFPSLWGSVTCPNGSSYHNGSNYESLMCVSLEYPSVYFAQQQYQQQSTCLEVCQRFFFVTVDELFNKFPNWLYDQWRSNCQNLIRIFLVTFETLNRNHQMH